MTRLLSKAHPASDSWSYVVLYDRIVYLTEVTDNNDAIPAPYGWYQYGIFSD